MAKIVPKYAISLVQFPTNGSIRFCIRSVNAKAFVKSTGEVLEASGLDAWYIQAIGQALHLDYSVYVFRFTAESRKLCQFLMHTQILKEFNYPLSTFPYKHTDVKFASRTPELKSNAWAFTQCFSPGVWVTFALALLVLAVMFNLTSTNKKGVLSSFFDILAAVLGNARSYHPRTAAQSALVWFWYFALTFIVLCFTSVLLSFLSVPLREKGLETIDDVYKGILEGKVKARAQNPAALATTIIAQNNTRSIVIGNDINKNGPAPEMFVYDMERHETVFEDSDLLELVFSQSRYKISQEAILEYWLTGLYFDKAFRKEMREKVDIVLLRLWAAGLIKRFDERGKLLVQLYYRRNYVEEEAVKPLSLSELSGVFYCLVAGHCLSIIVLILEICAKKCEGKKKKALMLKSNLNQGITR